MEITKDIGESIARFIFPGGDNFYYNLNKHGKCEFSYTNDYPLQHGKGESITMPKNIAEIIYKHMTFKKVITEKIKESKEFGDGEVPKSSYWYQCGLYDALQIIEKN